jgi:raffinose/stachyose/melibiose transport system substrate-binding protein
MTDLLNQVQTIRDAGYIPIAMSNGDGWPMQSCLLSTLAEREGGIQWFTSAVSGTASWSDAAFVRALDDILQLSTAGAFPPKINGMAYGEEGKLFINEQAVYLIDGDWKTGYFMGAMWDVQKSNIDYAAFPAVTNQQGQEGSVSVVMEGFAMKAATVDPVATGALAWINFFAGEEGSRIRFNRGDWTTAYNKLDTTGMDQMFVKYRQFLASHPYGWILDTVINSDSIGMLNAGIQAMMKGGGQNAPFPQDVADEFQGSFSQ